MANFQTITCPVCGESFEISVDPSEGTSSFIVDCEVCCRPMNVSVEIEAGEIISIDVTAA